MPNETWIPLLLSIAWLLPLLGFAIEIFAGYWQKTRLDKTAAYLAVFCIASGFVASTAATVIWGRHTGWSAFQAEDHHETEAGEHHAAAADAHAGHEGESRDQHAGDDEHSAAGHAHAPTPPITGTFYTLARFGSLRIAIDYYIDSLTLLMFVMVTLIATCIHVFAIGYMSDELTYNYVDHQVHMPSGDHLHRPGRFYKFFAYMSLFCFSMLGLVLAGNIFQVFVFWELVGVCSYFLIGFYVERKSASTAANKAFIMNRVGDFGFLIGLMVIWTYFGTFSFGEKLVDGEHVPGLFQMVRGVSGDLQVDDAGLVHLHDQEGRTIPYLLLVVAGLGIFAGCIGKSAQFPLQTWLPDAMEGPTPVSALVHSATMVAAGVYLAGRFYPMFTPEVLLVIAYIGCITLFVAATIAVVATDIKRVLAYSTISQLGYMMLGIGVAGWGAGLFHLVTHAFFKSLMFLASGSVIVGCHHEQEMPRMGGLWRKMPITAFTMLVGVIAISGLAIPGVNIYGGVTFGNVLAFSGYHSKDAIVATAMSFTQLNPAHLLLFIIPLITAGITAFYMFRLWFYTFAGTPRDHHIYDHAHESPKVMTVPLIVLAVCAAFCAVNGEGGPLYLMLTDSEPSVVAEAHAAAVTNVLLPGHDDVHAVHATAGLYALLAAFAGTVVAYVLYGAGIINPGEIKRQFAGLHRFLVEKWQFDTLYDVMFVRPAHVVARACAWVDRAIFDGLIHGGTRAVVDVSHWDRKFDEGVVDGLVNLTANVIYATGRSFRRLQTGMLRQYVMFIAVGVLTLFVLVFTFFPK